jgi:hypothetical protein
MQSAQRDEEEPGSSASLTTMQSAQRDEEEPGSSASLTTMQSAQRDEDAMRRSRAVQPGGLVRYPRRVSMIALKSLSPLAIANLA